MATHVPLARTQEPARHRAGATKTPRQLLWRFFWRGKWHYFPMLLSDHGRMILERKYDAVATDHAYDVRPGGKWGPVGRAIDRRILNYPLHEGMRQRLRLVSDALLRAVRRQGSDVRLLSAPCGLARDLVETARLLGADAARVRWVAADLDASGEVLALAAARVKAIGLPVEFLKEDLFVPSQLEAWVRREGRFNVANCIGLFSWMELADVERLAAIFRSLLERGGTFVVDNWYPHKQSKVGRDLEIHTRYHETDAFVAAIERAGFRRTESKDAPNGTCAVHVFEAR